MSRLAFALALPALVVLFGAVIFADFITSGFHGEGCRSPGDTADRWARGREWLMVQAMFFVPFGLLLWGMRTALTNRLALVGRAPWLGNAIVGLGLLMFATFVLSTFHFSLNCNTTSGPSPIPIVIAGLLPPMTKAFATVLALVLVAGYAIGLSDERRS